MSDNFGFRTAALFAIVLVLWGCAHTPPLESSNKPFRFERDRLGFANETVWNYVDGKPQPRRDEGGDDESYEEDDERYTRRCFVVARATVQFWKFAKFDPSQAPFDEEMLAKQIRKVTNKDVWRDPLPDHKRVVFPGYKDLKQLSSAQAKVFRDHLGLGWPVYFRAGNAPMVVPPTRASQEKLHQEIVADLKKNYPTIVWLINFPSLSINHAVVVYDYRKVKEKFIFKIYDPNYLDSPKELTYDPQSKTFSFEKTFYFVGGAVDVRPLYRSPLQ